MHNCSVVIALPRVCRPFVAFCNRMLLASFADIFCAQHKKYFTAPDSRRPVASGVAAGDLPSGAQCSIRQISTALFGTW